MTLQVAVVHLVEVEMRSSAIRAVKKATTLESATNTTVASVDQGQENTDVVVEVVVVVVNETTDDMEDADHLVIPAEDLVLHHLLQDTVKALEIAVRHQTAVIIITTVMSDVVHPAEESAADPRKISVITQTSAVLASTAGRTEQLDLSHV